ncbi:protoglobin domain-containing protein [Arthrobacter sp. GCM10027362]|uniref:protoglobin domain-containing protein n=1 Tax=Arthrobacter sp. GCM10027362 TaxID=3273379 RepID=UPI00363B9B55
MAAQPDEVQIPGYTYGSAAHSPVTLDELEKLKASVTFGEEDAALLRRAGGLLEDQVEDILDVWYGFVAGQPQLVAQFSRPGGAPIAEYLQAVRPRFGQWIRDTCNRPYDQAWLDYQQEIALRHTPARKNETDHVSSTEVVPLRYLIALIVPISTTVRPFLAKREEDPAQVDAMLQAWTKAVVLHVALWSRPYTRDGQW